MESQNQITEVIFRIMKGEVIALFPHEVNDFEGNVLSYQHIGQHSSADYKHCIRNSKNALPSEALPLYTELEKIGYKLVVIKKQNYSKYLKSLKEIRK